MASDKIINFTASDFKQVLSDSINTTSETKNLYLIDFWADWCGPCKVMAPVLDWLSDAQKVVKVSKVHVDNEQEILVQFAAKGVRITSIPAFYVIEVLNGDFRIVGNHIGSVTDREKFKQIVLNIVENDKI